MTSEELETKQARTRCRSLRTTNRERIHRARAPHRLRWLGGILLVGFAAIAPECAAQPAAPSDLTFSAITATTMTLHWQDNSEDESDFRIEQGTYFGPPAVEIATVPANSTVYDVTGLDPNTYYLFRVRAHRQSDNTYSTYVDGLESTSAADPIPAPFTDVTGSTITANWLPNGNPAGTRYYCENVDTAQASGWTLETAWTETGLSPATTYHYRVKARNAGLRETDWVALGSETTAGALIAPSTFSVDMITTTSLRLNFVDNATDEDGYEIDRWVAPSWIRAGTAVADATSYQGPGTMDLQPASPQRFRVRAYREGGPTYSDWLESPVVYLLANAPQAASFSGITASRIVVHWATNGNHSLAEYRAENVSTSENSGWISGTSWESADLVANSTYAFRVQARNRAGAETAWTDLGEVQTAAEPPPAPTNCTLDQITAESVRVQWVNEATDEGEIQVERAPTSGLPWTLVGVVPSGATEYAGPGTTGLSPGTGYFFRVRLLRSADEQYSDYSNHAFANTLVRPAIAAGFSSITCCQITAHWVPDGTPEQIEYFCENTGLGSHSGWIGTTSWISAGLVFGTTYSFRVKARNADGAETVWTALGEQATAGPPPSAPAACDITILSATALRVDWVDQSEDETRFDVERYVEDTWVHVGSTAASATTYTATGTTGLAEGSAQRFRVRAYRTTDEQYSEYATSPVRYLWVTPPIAETFLAVTPFSVMAKWSTTCADGLAEFRCENLEAGTSSGWVTSRSWFSTPLLPGTSYSFRVKARNLDGVETGWVSLGIATTEAADIPATVGNMWRLLR